MVVCCCLQTYNLNVNLEGMGLVLGQSWMVVPINGRILFCPPIIMYCKVCCCLHIHSVVNMLVMGRVLGQSWMVVPINGHILFCPPIIMYCKVCCCLHIHSVVNASDGESTWAKFDVHIYHRYPAICKGMSPL